MRAISLLLGPLVALAAACDPQKIQTFAEAQSQACRAICLPRSVHRFSLSTWDAVECECAELSADGGGR